MRASNIVWVLLPTVVLSDWLSGGLLSILITADGGDPFVDLLVPTTSSQTELIPTKPAADCLQRALNLTNGCQPFLKLLNQNGGDLSLMTVFQILELAKGNETATLSCYQKTLSCFNGGCVCDNSLIALIQNLPTSTVPTLVKETLKLLNQAKCPKASPPPASSGSPESAPPPPKAKAKEVTVEVKKIG